MNVIESIKDALFKQFDSTLSAQDIIFSLLFSALLSLLIILVYRKTFSGVVYNRNIVLSILLITLTTAMIIRTINSNLSLSLGMVGALSIVRFRTAIKDPVDTAFLFWGITAGIMCGAGLYFLSVIGSLGIALIFYLSFLYSIKNKTNYLLIVNYETAGKEKVEEIINKISGKELKNKSMSGKMTEDTYKISYKDDNAEIIDELNDLSFVKNVNLLEFNNDFEF